MGRVEQKCCRTLNTTILYDHPVQRSPTRHWYLPNDTNSRLAVSWIEVKQTEAAKDRGRERKMDVVKQTDRERRREGESKRERKEDRRREVRWGQECYRVRVKRA